MIPKSERKPIANYTRVDKVFGATVAEGGSRGAGVPRGIMEAIFLDGKPKAVNFLCPCGCGRNVFLPVSIPESEHTWDWNAGGHFVHPSVRSIGACKAHYYIGMDLRVEFLSDHCVGGN